MITNVLSKNKRTGRPAVPEGLWIRCPKCGKIIYKDEVVEHQYSCPLCGSYFRIRTNTRLKMILDAGSFEEWDADIKGQDPLDFPGYKEKLKRVQEQTKLTEAVKTGTGTIDGQSVAIGICDARFLMGSMGSAVGEKITRLFERAEAARLPVILFCCSGGARMQEGIVSLMQMAKTAAAVRRHSEAGLLYISALTDPVTGGVTASFAMLGDIILAEPGALIGFAGPRVISQTIGAKLPEGFQRAEFLLEHGMIDQIVTRPELKGRLAQLLRQHDQQSFGYEAEVTDAEAPVAADYSNVGPAVDAWENVTIARNQNRAGGMDYITALTDGFTELHGDRLYGDDKAVRGGIARFMGRPVTVLTICKGSSTKEQVSCNFGMPSPEGYRKALRLMKQAEKFNRPVIAFIDTPGAFPGVGAEERGQGEAIARNLMEMSGLKVPLLSIITGEGGSGGALALAVADEVWMMEHAVYSILSPEGFASILWKDSHRAKEAAGVMKMTARDLAELGIIDQIVPEEVPVTKANIGPVIPQLQGRIAEFLKRYEQYSSDELVQKRYERFRKM